MYAIFRNVIELKTPKDGWGTRPREINIGTADDIERIHFHYHRIRHTPYFEMTTDEFNASVLDLTGVSTIYIYIMFLKCFYIVG